MLNICIKLQLITGFDINYLDNCFGINETNYRLAFKIPEAEDCTFQFVL